MKIFIDSGKAVFEREISDSVRALIPPVVLVTAFSLIFLREYLIFCLGFAYSALIVMLVITEFFPDEVWSLRKDDGLMIQDHAIFGKVHKKTYPKYIVYKRYFLGDTLLLSYEQEVFDLTPRSVFFFRENEVKKLAKWLGAELKEEIL